MTVISRTKGPTKGDKGVLHHQVVANRIMIAAAGFTRRITESWHLKILHNTILRNLKVYLRWIVNRLLRRDWPSTTSLFSDIYPRDNRRLQCDAFSWIKSLCSRNPFVLRKPIHKYLFCLSLLETSSPAPKTAQSFASQMTSHLSRGEIHLWMANTCTGHSLATKVAALVTNLMSPTLIANPSR